MSSIEPNDCCGEVNGGEKIAGGFVIACGDGAKLLELGEEVLDEVARLVDVTIEVSWCAAVRLGRDHRSLASGREGLNDPLVGVEGFVGDQDVGLHGGQQVVGAIEIMGLPTGQQEAGRIAKGVDSGMNFGGQPTAGEPDRLVFTDFFLAPALC